MTIINDTATDEMRGPKDVRIREIMLETKFGEITLYDLFEEIQIFEDIFTNTLSGNISLSDSRNIPNVFEITGGEKLRLSFKSAGFSEYVDLEVYIYKISERFLTKERHAIYTLHFCSRECIKNQLLKVSRSLNGTCTEMVQEMFTSPTYGLGSTKPINAEETINVMKYIIPHWSPLKTINWLCKRSVSALYSGSPFVFFENKKEYVYSSLEKLYNTQPKKDYVYSPKLDQSSSRDLSEDLNKVENYVVKSSVDLLKSIAGGRYASRLITFDLLYKKYNVVDYDYVTDFNANFPGAGRALTIESNKSFDGLPIQQAYTSRIMNFTKHVENMSVSDGSPYSENNYHEMWAASYDSGITKLDTICIDIKCPGDSSINVGDTINFNVSSFESTGGGERKADKYLTGKYLITAIASYIRKDTFEMSMEICKDSFYEPLTGLVNETV